MQYFFGNSNGDIEKIVFLPPINKRSIKQKFIIMKKIFTFFVALVMFAFAFAQEGNFYPTALDQAHTMAAKSNWYGHMSGNTWSHSSFTEGVIIAYRFAANELPVGGQIEKIHFYAFKDNNGQNFNTQFNVIVYTGGDGSFLDTNTYTADLTICGTVATQQTYNVTANGDQNVVLNTPVTVPANQEVWIAIECLGNSALVFDVDENSELNTWSTTSVWKKYYSQDDATFWTAPRWCADEDCENTRPGEWELGCYVNDGQAYVPTSDIYVRFYDPFLTSGQNQVRITEQVIDENYEYDSLYVCFAAWNNGPDSAEMSNYHLILTAEGQGEPIEILNENWGDDPSSAGEYYAVGYGFLIGSIPNGSPFSICGLDEFADYGLSYPFNICFEVRFGGNDPNPVNNRACLRVTDQASSTGIQEQAAQTWSVYPNPANNQITINNVAGAEISIFNLAGQQVAGVNVASATQTINVANLSEGLYIIRVVTDGKISTGKFNVVR